MGTVRWDVAIPPFAVGLSLGLVLLVYGLQKTSGVLSRLADTLHIRKAAATARKPSLKPVESPAKPSDVRIIITPLKSLRSRGPKYSSFPIDDLDKAVSGYEGHPAAEAKDEQAAEQSLSRRVTFRAEPDTSPDFEPSASEATTPRLGKLGSRHASFTPRTSWVRGCSCQGECEHVDRWTCSLPTLGSQASSLSLAQSIPRQRSLVSQTSIGKPPIHPTLSHSTPNSFKYGSPEPSLQPSPEVASSSSSTTASQPMGTEEPTPISPFTPGQPQAEETEEHAAFLDTSEFTCKNPADLAWHDIRCTVRDATTGKQKHVLTQISGHVVPGEMCALIGPSGAGKSTLLDILAMRKKGAGVEGDVLMNGSQRARKFKRLSAYVPQEDVFEPTLYAWETLDMHAQLRLPNSTPKAERISIMEEAMHAMGLWKARQTQVGGLLPGGIRVRGLSGGEQRRLSIACALIATPSIMFLDEPTSGLDAFAALSIMDYVAQLATKGHTCIATIHAPRTAIWAKFHKVSLLSEGRLMYFGAPDEATQWFGSLGYPWSPETEPSMSDFIIDLVSTSFHKPSQEAATMTSKQDVLDAGDAFYQANTSLGCINAALPLTRKQARDEMKGVPRYPASWLRQVGVLYRQALLAQLRNPSDTSGRIFVTVFINLLVGLTFFNTPDTPSATFQRYSSIFFTLLANQLLPFCYMSFLTASRRFFYADMEAKLYNPTAYDAAQLMAGVPLVVVTTLCGSFTAYGLTGLRITAGALVFSAIINSLNSLVAIQFLTLCTWLTPNQDLAFVLGTAYESWCILTVGFYIRLFEFRIAPCRWFAYVNYSRYALQGLAWSEEHGKVFAHPESIITGLPGASVGSTSGSELATGAKAGFKPTQIKTGQDVLEYYHFTLSPGAAIGILLAFWVVFHALSYLAMTRIRHGK